MDNLPKIAVLARLFPNIVQTYIVNQITGLIDLGIDTAIIAEKDPRQRDINPAVLEYRLLDKTFYADKGIAGLSRLAMSAANPGMVFRLLLSGIWFRFGFLYGLRAIMRASAIARCGCRLIHSQSFFSSYNFLFAREYLGIPMVTTYHGMVPRGVNKLAEPKTKQVIDRTDIFIVNTEFARSELIGLGCEAGRIRIIPQGTDIDRFRFSPRRIERRRPIRLLTVARLSPEKGHDTAIQALATLVDDYPELEYHIIGDGPEKDSITGRIKELGVEKNVMLHAFMTGDTFMQKFAETHIFILPSINFNDGYLVETQGVVLQEAQSCGIPVIGSDAGGIPDVIRNGETGLVFEQENHGQLAQKIRQLIDDTELYQALCTAGRTDVEQNYSIPVVCRKLATAYEELLECRITPG